MKRRLCRMLSCVFPFAGLAVFARGHAAGAREGLLLLENVRVFAAGRGAFSEPLEILRGATSYAAAWLGLDQRRGSLEPGKAADIVILDQDPLARIENIRSVWLVVRNGAMLSD